jgi:hypothetical protein
MYYPAIAHLSIASLQTTVPYIPTIRIISVPFTSPTDYGKTNHLDRLTSPQALDGNQSIFLYALNERDRGNKMKKQLILIISATILSSTILSTVKLVLDQQSAFSYKYSPADMAVESAQLSEDPEDLPLSDNPSPIPESGQKKQNTAKFIKSLGKEVTSVDDQSGKNSSDENSADQASESIQPPTSGEKRLDEGFVTRLPMEDQYHSQISETSLPNACGPAALMMVLDYFKVEQSLAEVIRKLQFSPAQGGYDPYCSTNPVCTSPGALVQVAREAYGLMVDAHEGWTLDEIQQSIGAGQPIIADIVWRLADEGPGHFVVIYGIDTKQEILFYHDPYDGAEKEASWEAFSVAWDGPVDQGDPLQPNGYAFWGMSLAP